MEVLGQPFLHQGFASRTQVRVYGRGMTQELLGDDWVPRGCTLPTKEQPLRRAEFDDLFTHDVLGVHRESAQRIRLELRPDAAVASRAAGLAARETGCCSFFAFDLHIADGAVSLGIQTEAAHEVVLAAFGARAESRLAGGS